MPRSPWPRARPICEAIRQRLTTARLRERQVIRRELHDGLVPWLAGLRLGLQGAQNLVATDPAAAAAMLAELQTELTRRIDDVRSASRSLLPPVLSELGLYAALIELVDRQQAAGMSVELVCSPSLPVLTLPDGLAAAAYGIASEAITNAARHSGTNRCRLEVDVVGDELRITCTDAGVGRGRRRRDRRRHPVHDRAGRGTRWIGHHGAGRSERHRGQRLAAAGAARPEPIVTEDPITVVVVDDHPVFRLGMVGLLGSLSGIRVVGQAARPSRAGRE